MFCIFYVTCRAYSFVNLKLLFGKTWSIPVKLPQNISELEIILENNEEQNENYIVSYCLFSYVVYLQTTFVSYCAYFGDTSVLSLLSLSQQQLREFMVNEGFPSSHCHGNW